MESQEYMEQARAARDELDALLRQTRLDLPVWELRAALGTLNRWIDGWEAVGTGPRVEAPPRRLDDGWDARRKVWRGLPRVERHRAVIEALGDSQLRLGDLADQVNALRDDWFVCRDAVQAVLYELLSAREVQREKRPAGKREQWHYFRTPVSAELADLQRRLEEVDDVR